MRPAVGFKRGSALPSARYMSAFHPKRTLAEARTSARPSTSDMEMSEPDDPTSTPNSSSTPDEPAVEVGAAVERDEGPGKFLHELDGTRGDAAGNKSEALHE